MGWAAVLGLGIWAALIEPCLLRMAHHRLALPLPAGAKPLRLALVADLHVGLFVRDWQLRRLVDVLNALEVDAVVIPGD